MDNDDDDRIEIVYNKRMREQNNVKSHNKYLDDKSLDDNSLDNEIKKKINLMNLNNGWNDKNEQLLISIGQNAASYKWMHEASSNYHNTVYNVTSISLTVLSSLLSIQTLFPNDTCGDNSNLAILIIKQVLLYIITIISFLQSFLNSQLIYQKHLFASGLFSELYHDIQEQMCMFRKDRVNAKQYVSEYLKKYDLLVVNNPDINPYIVRKFQKTFGKTGVTLPNGFDKIQIITEETIDNISKLNIGEPKSLSKPDNTCHLAEINNIYQIHGDISDIELDFLKSKKFEHEYKRFLEHSQEND